MHSLTSRFKNSSLRLGPILLVGVIFAFIAHAQKTSQRTPEEWSQHLGIPVEKFKAYNQVLDRIETEFAEEAEQRDFKLQIRKHWQVRQYGIQVRRKGKEARVHITGGALRHPGYTRDIFAFIVCHELGHHFGGFPKQPDSPWNSVEGQADYFATSKCMRRIFTEQEQLQYMKTAKISDDIRQACEKQFSEKLQKIQCMRNLKTALDVAYLSLEIKKPSLKTKDPSVVEKTKLKWPAPQCRLDTFIQGALCKVSASTPLSDTDPSVGACKTDEVGARPRCWFAPGAEK